MPNNASTGPAVPRGRTGSCRPSLALALALTIGGTALATAGPPEPLDQPAPAERCARLIALFDLIVQSRFDHRLLAIEQRQFEDARELRLRAEDDCAADDTWFGLQRIEDALSLIGAPALDTERLEDE